MNGVADDDRGLTLGDGLFETVLALDGRLIDWDAHLARMTASCLALSLPPPEPGEALAVAEAALQRASSHARIAVRLTLTAGSGGRGLDRPAALVPRLMATAAAAPKPPGPATAAIVAIRRNTTSPASRHKTLSYLDNVLARAEARRRGCDEAILLNERGELACAAAANLFWLEGDVLFTPALECGVLPGIMRASLMRRFAGEVREVSAAASVLDGAEAVFLTNSLIGVRRVEAIDGRRLPPYEQVLATADVDPGGEAATRATI